MGAFLPIFQDLLRKAEQPVQAGPKLTVPAPLRTPKPSTMASEADHINHQRKQHYKTFEGAHDVVKRSKQQEPKRQWDLHAYPCPVCGDHIVGHKTKFDDSQSDWRANLQPLRSW